MREEERVSKSVRDAWRETGETCTDRDTQCTLITHGEVNAFGNRCIPFFYVVVGNRKLGLDHHFGLVSLLYGADGRRAMNRLCGLWLCGLTVGS